MAERGGWAAFRADLAAALAAWRLGPAIPLISVALAVASLIPEPGFWLLMPLGAFGVGWPGTERLFYLRAFRGLPILRPELWRATWSYFGRFFTLGVAATVWGLGIVFVYATTSNEAIRLGAVAVAVIVLDVFLTFATPALAYSTRRVSIAVRLGHRTLVDHWPASAWYAVVPPLAMLVVLRLLPRTVVGLRGQILLTSAAALLNLWFKGAAAAFYLRHHEVGDDGAVNASHLETLDRKMRERFRPDEP